LIANRPSDVPTRETLGFLKSHVPVGANILVGDTNLVVLNGNSCRAGHLNDCKPKISNPRTGGTPDFAAVDPSSQTVYVANIDELTISIAQDKY
jgi:hypothetical protein